MCASNGVATHAQALGPAFSSAYSVKDLGPLPLEEGIGGIALHPTNPTKLLFRMTAGQGTENSLHEVTVTRGADQRITGFSSPTRFVALTPSENGATGASDGSLAVHSSGTVLYTSYNDATVGQVKAGSQTRDKLINLDDLGYPSGGGGLAIVPAGLPGAGRFKVAASSTWTDGALIADGEGTFDLSEPSNWIELPQDAGGIAYVKAGEPVFSTASILMTTQDDAVIAYTANQVGDPNVGSARLFLTNLPNVSGITVDIVTGDILVSGRGNRIYAIGKFQSKPITVRLVEPTAGATYPAPGTVRVTAEAEQPGGAISKVDFYAGDTLFATEINSPYVAFAQNLAAGNYAIRVVATDSGGSTATSSVVNISVTNVINQLPTVRLTTPTNNTHLNSCSSIALRAEASDPDDGGIAFIEFYNGQALLGRDSTFPYEWTITNASPGNYQLKAVATDVAGASATSATAHVMVMGPSLHESHTGMSPEKNMLFCFNGIAGKRYVIETKATLQSAEPWTPVRTNTITAGSLMEFVDEQTRVRKSAFFRVRALE